MCYIGNVYGRYEQAKDFFSKMSERHKVIVFGNWLEPGVDRPGEIIVKRDRLWK